MTEQQEWKSVSTFKEVPTAWWDVMLDGNLWLVYPHTFPFQFKDPGLSLSPRLRSAARYRLNERGLTNRGLISRNADDRPGISVYFQVLPEGVRIGRAPIPTATVHEAPQVPKRVLRPLTKPPSQRRPTPVLELADYSDRLARLDAARGELEPAPPAALLLFEHPILSPYLAMCDCETENWRVHHRSCALYSSYPILEKLTNGLDESPEEWLLKQKDRYKRIAILTGEN